MKDFELTMRLRNNHLKRRRLELGLSPRQIAEQTGVGYQTYLDLEGLRMSPLSKLGGWLPSAEKIAEFHGVGPEELWPEAVLSVVQPVVTREIDAGDFRELMFDDGADVDPERLLMDRELAEGVQEAIDELPPRQREVIRRRMMGYTLEEAGIGLPVTIVRHGRKDVALDNDTVSRERARGLEFSALQRLSKNQLLDEVWSGEMPARRPRMKT